MKPILAARFTADGKHRGMHYLRREFGRGVHNWLVKFDIVDPQTGVEGVDDRMQDEIRVRGGSLDAARLAAMQAVNDMLPHQEYLRKVLVEFWVIR